MKHAEDKAANVAIIIFNEDLQPVAMETDPQSLFSTDFSLSLGN